MDNLRWIREFPALDDIDPYNPDPVAYQMHATLDAFAAGVLPNDEYTFAHLLHFITSIIKEQKKPDTFITWGGNWSVIPTDKTAPSDVRVELIFFPSYIAVSLLTLFWYRYPKEAEAIPGFFTALHEGLYFITARGLYGHGIEGDEQRDEAIRILLKGKVHHYLQENLDNCEKCQALYAALIQFKTDYFRKRAFRFEYLELINELGDFPNIALTETPYFSWCPGSNSTIIILEAPYTVSPDSEITTKEIVMDVAARTSCAAILGKVSKQDKRYTGALGSDNEDAVIAYNQIIKKIVECKRNAGDQKDEEKQILHLIIRGMADRDGLDVEISTRNGRSCDRDILEGITDRLPWNLERYSQRAYTVSVDSLFGGGSKYLDFFKEGYPGRQDLPGFGQSHNALEIRLSHTIRTLALGRIKDSLVQAIESFMERNYV